MFIVEEEERKGVAFACRCLAMKSMHSQELRKKLQDKGYTQGVIDHTISLCQVRHWLNDQQFCTRFVEKLRQQGKSAFEISIKARIRGIPQEEIEPYLQKNNDEALSLLISKRYQILLDPEALDNQKLRRKAIQSLIRRGFSIHDIYAVMRKNIR